MIRFLLRAAAFLLLAGGFVALVLDGARSIAANGLAWLDAGTVASAMAPQKLVALQKMAPGFWDGFMATALKGPAFAYLLVAGALLLWLTKPPAPKIGYSSRP